MTNSRGFTVEQTTRAHNEIAEVVDAVARETGKEYIFISRSDSTLRGHYPLETKLLKANYEKYTQKEVYDIFIKEFWNEELSSKYKKPSLSEVKEMKRLYVRHVSYCDMRGNYQWSYYTLSEKGGSGAIKIWRILLR